MSWADIAAVPVLIQDDDIIMREQSMHIYVTATTSLIRITVPLDPQY